MTTRAIKMLPYKRGTDIDYASLDFDPDEARAEKPDAMKQHKEQAEVFALLSSRFTDFHARPDVFLDFDSFICYDPSNLNVRVSPDVYLVFGVDSLAIPDRRLYLPWEAGKPPDWVLEIASPATAREDVERKPAIYARIGVPEYWRFDPSGGRYHGEPLYGGILTGGEYRPVELTIAPDGILKGYSPLLGLSLAWDEGWPRFYDPSTGAYLENWREAAFRAEQETARAEEESTARAEAEAQAIRAESRAAEAEAEVRWLREQLRREDRG